jgi:hypothetical protein
LSNHTDTTLDLHHLQKSLNPETSTVQGFSALYCASRQLIYSRTSQTLKQVGAGMGHWWIGKSQLAGNFFIGSLFEAICQQVFYFWNSHPKIKQSPNSLPREESVRQLALQQPGYK